MVSFLLTVEGRSAVITPPRVLLDPYREGLAGLISPDGMISLMDEDTAERSKQEEVTSQMAGLHPVVNA